MPLLSQSSSCPGRPPLLNASADANIGATSELAKKARFQLKTRGFEPFSSA
jgi:hypothetical protein